MSGVMKAVLCTSYGARGICQYPVIKSILDRYFLSLSHHNSSSAVVTGSGSTSVIFQKFTHTLLDPSFLTLTKGNAYGDVMVSQLPSQANCPLHFAVLHSWHTTMDMAYI